VEDHKPQSPGVACATASHYFLLAMRVRPLRSRFLALAISLVQILGPAVATFADAQLQAAAASPNAAAHIESHQRPECARVHPDDCALCQYLTTGAGHPNVSPTPPAAAVIQAPPVARLLGSGPSLFGALPRTRAPPGVVPPEA
jgi:hypothetical protein